MKRFMRTRLLLVFWPVVFLTFLTGTAMPQQKRAVSDDSSQRAAIRVQSIAKEVRHELVTLPYYGVFDWLEGNVKPDGTVVLRGDVVRPSTKSDAEHRVKDIEAVTRVVNEIQVLPLSPNDDQLRVAVYRALFNWNSPLFRYSQRAVPPIHIVINNGRATLKGFVASPMDKQLAYTYARGVPGLFEVKNELKVDSSS